MKGDGRRMSPGAVYESRSLTCPECGKITTWTPKPRDPCERCGHDW